MAELAQAVSKVKGEMDANKGNTYIQVVGDFLLKQMNDDPGLVKAVLTDGKTILKSLDTLRKEAQKKQFGNVAVLADAEAFAIVVDYFKRVEPVAKTTDTKTKPTPEKPKTEKPTSPPAETPQVQDEEPDEEFDFDALLE
jgi:hypothetical protein